MYSHFTQEVRVVFKREPEEHVYYRIIDHEGQIIRKGKLSPVLPAIISVQQDYPMGNICLSLMILLFISISKSSFPESLFICPFRLRDIYA